MVAHSLILSSTNCLKLFAFFATLFPPRLGSKRIDFGKEKTSNQESTEPELNASNIAFDHAVANLVVEDLGILFIRGTLV